MIIGRLSDVAHHEKLLPPAVARALKAIQSLDLEKTSGRHTLEGELLAYTLEERPLRTEKEYKSEAHVHHADIHIPLSSSERFGFSVPQPGLPIVDDQTASRDLAFYADPANESFFVVDPGMYVVFLPEELHRPCLAVTEPKPIRKIIVKIHTSLLEISA